MEATVLVIPPFTTPTSLACGLLVLLTTAAGREEAAGHTL
ncbi:MAG: hypothetical protein JWM80_5162 [Cyanobacteria bacterium RYN_339]|nr:hypothetical protein [Cyanobacteria bacterium RYN_339]